MVYSTYVAHARVGADSTILAVDPDGLTSWHRWHVHTTVQDPSATPPFNDELVPVSLHAELVVPPVLVQSVEGDASNVRTLLLHESRPIPWARAVTR